MALKILPGVHLDIVNLTCLMARLGRVPPKTRIWEKMETWAVAEALFLASALHISAQVGPRAMKILPDVPLAIPLRTESEKREVTWRSSNSSVS